MPALNFQKRFADDVESGRKCQTIRAPRKDGRDPCAVYYDDASRALVGHLFAWEIARFGYRFQPWRH